MTSSARVCAIMVTYNRLDTLKTAIQHVLTQQVLPSTLVVVDNNSTDGTKEYLVTLAGLPNVHCIFLHQNTGSAGAIADGMKYALQQGNFDHCWVLDDDTFYKENALSDLLEYMAASPFALLGLKGAHIRFGKKIPVDKSKKIQQADYAMIDGALISMDAIQQVGVVNEKFFMMCDDHEYCVRLRKHGFTVGVLQNDADERLYLGGQSGFTRATLWRGYYSSRNHLLIIRQYFSLMNLLGYIFLQVKLLIAAAVFAPDRFLRVKLRLQGIWHGMRGIGGKTLDPQTLQFTAAK